jgi:hypothetical protein
VSGDLDPRSKIRPWWEAGDRNPQDPDDREQCLERADALLKLRHGVSANSGGASEFILR